MVKWTNRDIQKLRNDPNDYPWDDIQVALSSARRPAANAPTWRTYNFGIGGGVAYEVLGFAINDYVDFYIQTSHSMLLRSVLDSHNHWTIPSDSADDRIKWQLDVIAAGIGDYFAVPDGSPYSKEYLLDGTESNKHNFLDIADIPEANTTVSSLYICRLTRVAASADDYSGEVYVLYNDSHYQKSQDGSYFDDALLKDEYREQKGDPSKPYNKGAW